MNLTKFHEDIINKFLNEQDMAELYRSYRWPPKSRKMDTWKNGFPDLFKLEMEISHAARENSLNNDHLLEIAKWGKLRNKEGISWRDPKKTRFYIDNSPVEWLEKTPERAISNLNCLIDGFGPTYCSKLLHFAVPQIFGALDTRLVRTFGENAKRYPLLKLKVIWSGRAWAIPTTQKGWPSEFGTWITSLNYIAQNLNRDKVECPHPQQYLQFGLRSKSVWLPADVETALFHYTYIDLDKPCSYSQ